MRFVTTCISYILLTATLLFSGSRVSDTLGQDSESYRQNIREWKHEQIREFNELLVNDVDSLYTFTGGLSSDSIYKLRGKFQRLRPDSIFGTVIGTAGDNVAFSSTGGMSFAGSGGLIYGSLYGNEIGWSQASAAQNTWYKINDADITDTLLNGITGNSAGRLIVSVDGIYYAPYSVTSEADATGKHIQIVIGVNSSPVNNGMTHYETFGTSKNFPASAPCILNLSAEDTVEVLIRTTDTGTPEISVDHVEIVLIQIGGGG